MEIDYWNLEWSRAFLDRGLQGKPTPLSQIRINDGDPIYRWMTSEPECSPGKTTFYTDTSGTVTETKYLGVIPVTVINIPQPVEEDDC